MNKTLLSAALMAGFGIAALAPQGANAVGASGGTISFSGSLVSSTCAVTVGGSNTSPNGTSASATVTLPAVSLVNGTLSTVGSSAAWTPFTLNLTGCPASLANGSGTAYSKVYPYFTGGGIDTGTGYLNNTGTAGTGVEIALSNTAATGSTALTLGGASGAQNTGTVALSAAGTGSFPYYAGYVVAPTGTIGAGTVISSVIYNLNYQ